MSLKGRGGGGHKVHHMIVIREGVHDNRVGEGEDKCVVVQIYMSVTRGTEETRGKYRNFTCRVKKKNIQCSSRVNFSSRK